MLHRERYPEVAVAGTPREMGRQIGEALRQEIHGFVEIALERVNKTVRVSREHALRVAAHSIPFVRDYSPDMLDEMVGMAEASGRSLEEIVLLQTRNQLHPDSESGCTSFSVLPRPSGRPGAMVGQNWDNDPALDPFTVVLTRRPLGKPAFMSLTQAGLIAYIGFNEHGIGVCLNTLPAPSRELGVPHYCTVRAIFESNSLDGAVEAVRRAERAIPANIMLATPQGPADLEVTLDSVQVLTDPGGRRLTHTNHCLHADLAPINERFPELIESRPRNRRIHALLERAGANDLETIQAALCDHDGYPRSICRHANEDPITGFWETVFSVIIETDALRMDVSRGNPCAHAYETYRLAAGN